MIASTTPKNPRRAKRLGTSCFAAAALTVASLTPVSSALAGATVSFGEDKSVSLGLGFRTSWSSVENGAPNGTSRSSDFSVESMRIYAGGSLTKNIKFTFNTEVTNNQVNLLDAYAQFEFMPEFNVWVGRMLPPSDRANLDGPYYLNAWDYPGIVSQYPSKYVGRDDGVTVWGKLFEKKLVYSFGVFMGHNRGPTLSNAGSNMLYAGRVAFNFLDPEDNPAYYTSSTYYGGADVLTLAVAGMYQKDGVGTAALKADYKAWNADLLFEKPFEGIGTVTIEGAYYDYGTNNVPDPGAPGVANSGGLLDGKAYLAGAAFMFPEKVGWGFFQPFGRYQYAKSDTFGASITRYDLGLNYVIASHNARISAVYTTTDATATLASDKFLIGLQLQF